MDCIGAEIPFLSLLSPPSYFFPYWLTVFFLSSPKVQLGGLGKLCKSNFMACLDTEEYPVQEHTDEKEESVANEIYTEKYE